MESSPKTEKNSKNILTLQDQLTKFCMRISLSHQKSKITARIFAVRFTRTLEASEAILIDPEKISTNNLMKEISKLLKIYKFCTSYLQSNELLERSDHIIKHFKQFTNEQKQWNRWINFTTFSYNINIYKTIKHTPYEMSFHKIARVLSHELFIPEDNLINYDKYLINSVIYLSKKSLRNSRKYS